MSHKQVQLRRLFSSSIGGSWGGPPEHGDVVLPCVRGTDLDFRRLRVKLDSAPLRSYTSHEVAYRAASQGDIIIEKSGGGDRQPVGRIALWDRFEAVMPTNFAGRLRPAAGHEPRYLTYLLAALYYEGHTVAAIKQTTGIQNLDLHAFLSTRVPLLELPTQRAIADYLDIETGRIDALISKKRRMIELLEERRAVELTSAVFGKRTSRTGRILGSWAEIPEHWDRPALSQVVRIAEGQVDPQLEPYRSMGLIAPNHIESGTGVLLAMQTAEEQGAISGKYLCGEGDVIYSKIRPALRKVIVSPTRCLTSADMYPLHGGPEVEPRYLAYFLLSEPFTELAILESDRVAMPKINRDSLMAIRIPLPPMAQQIRIANRLDDKFTSISRMGDALRRQISLMLERRQALITTVVTGETAIPGVAA